MISRENQGSWEDAQGKRLKGFTGPGGQTKLGKICEQSMEGRFEHAGAETDEVGG